MLCEHARLRENELEYWIIRDSGPVWCMSVCYDSLLANHLSEAKKVPSETMVER